MRHQHPIARSVSRKADEDLRTAGRSAEKLTALQCVVCQLLVEIISPKVSHADIEQVQNEKKPFTLRCMPCRTTQPNSGEGHRWNRSGSNVGIISDSSCLSSKIDASLR